MEYYLNQHNKLLPGDAALSTGKLALTPQSDNVYPVTHAITRYGLASDEPNKWRYYLDAEEVHLPPFWEQYITADNHVDVIRRAAAVLNSPLPGGFLISSDEGRQWVNHQQPLVPLNELNALDQ